MSERNESIKRLAELIKDVRIAMLTTVEPDGSLRARPMATQKAEFDGELWFFTYADTPKVDEIAREHQVNVSYSKPDDNAWISVSGSASLVRDRNKIEELWQPMLKAWFPEGKEDPRLALLRVDVEQAEYWDASSSKMVLIPGFIKSLVTGQEFQPGENEKLALA